MKTKGELSGETRERMRAYMDAVRSGSMMVNVVSRGTSGEMSVEEKAAAYDLIVGIVRMGEQRGGQAPRGTSRTPGADIPADAEEPAEDAATVARRAAAKRARGRAAANARLPKEERA